MGIYYSIRTYIEHTNGELDKHTFKIKYLELCRTIISDKVERLTAKNTCIVNTLLELYLSKFKVKLQEIDAILKDPSDLFYQKKKSMNLAQYMSTFTSYQIYYILLEDVKNTIKICLLIILKNIEYLIKNTLKTMTIIIENIKFMCINLHIINKVPGDLFYTNPLFILSLCLLIQYCVLYHQSASEAL